MKSSLEVYSGLPAAFDAGKVFPPRLGKVADEELDAAFTRKRAFGRTSDAVIAALRRGDGKRYALLGLA